MTEEQEEKNNPQNHFINLIVRFPRRLSVEIIRVCNPLISSAFTTEGPLWFWFGLLLMKKMTSIRTSGSDEPVASVSTTTAVQYNRPHLDIGLWLKTLELTQYRTLFEKKFYGVEVRNV